MSWKVIIIPFEALRGEQTGTYKGICIKRKETTGWRSSLPGLEPGTSGLEVQRARPLRHRDLTISTTSAPELKNPPPPASLEGSQHLIFMAWCWGSMKICCPAQTPLQITISRHPLLPQWLAIILGMICISLSSRDAAKTWMQACICISGNLSAASLARLRAELNPGVESIAATPLAPSQHPHCRSQER